MPWCSTCNRFLSPSTVRVDGTCPTCGGTIDQGATNATLTAEHDDRDDRTAPLPWHLWLLAAAVAIYLGFRAWQGIEWLIQSL